MRRAAALGLGLLTMSLVLLTACATGAPSEGSAPTPTTSEMSTPDSSPTASAKESLVVATDGLTLRDGGSEQAASFTDGAALLAMVSELTGSTPTGVAVEPYEGYDIESTRYEFDGIWVVVSDTTGQATITVTAPTVAGVPVVTTSGISVGSTRSDVVAAGAVDGWDENSDGVPDEMQFDRTEVAGTTSLVTPDAVGSTFMTARLDGDVVTKIWAPADDYSDL